MELIPIIYTVLAIAVVGAALTLIISYLAYKYKRNQEENSKPEIEIVKTPPRILPKPHGIPHKPHAKKPGSQPEPKKTREMRKTKQRVSTKERTRQKGKEIPEQNKRISVLKNLRDTKSNDAQFKKNPKQEKRNSASTLGENILDKYTEEDDKNLYTLSVREEKKKKK